MVVFGIILCIILLLYIFILILFYSTLKIEISNLKMSSCKKPKKIVKDYLFIIRIVIFSKITLFKIKIYKDKLHKLEKSKLIKKINNFMQDNLIEEIRKLLIENRKQFFNKSIIKAIKELNIKVTEFKLNLDIGTKDAISTSFIVALISSLISIILANTIKDFNSKNYKYLVTPYYIDKNFFRLKLNCIIYLKMVHIINIIISLKRSGSIYDRTSNRRSYDYCYEKHTRYGRCKYNYRRSN